MLAYGLFCAVKTIQYLGFVKERSFRRVHVLGRFKATISSLHLPRSQVLRTCGTGENPPGKSDDAPGTIGDRKYYSVPEFISERPPLALFRKSRFLYLFF